MSRNTHLFEKFRASLPRDHRLCLHESLVRHRLIGARQKTSDSSQRSRAEGSYLSLRVALQEAGDVSSLFGLYLSTRVDLLSIEDCTQLSHISDTAPLAALADVQGFVERELGTAISQAFLAVEPMPYAASLLRHSYIAMLENGENISLHVLRREFRPFPEEQLDALYMLRECGLFRHWAPVTISEVIEDFARELHQRADQLAEATAFEMLAMDAQAGDGLWVPRTLRKFCRNGILGLERRPLLKLSSVKQHGTAHKPDFALAAVTDVSAEKAARILCFLWLRQVFDGRIFPVQFGHDDIFLLEDGRVAFLGAVYATPSAEINEKLWKYLLAAAADDPDECCRSLLSLMSRTNLSRAYDQVLAHFRQSVTCFMSAPGQPDFCSGVAARILRQLQIATQAGYRPSPSLVAFYRGLFSALAAVRTLDPDCDPVLEAIESLWATHIFGSGRRMIGIDTLADIGSKYLAAMIELPIRLETVLLQANRNPQDGFPERAVAAVPDNDWSHRVAIVLVLAAVYLLVSNGPFHLSSQWADRISFLVCCVIGLLLLRIAARL